MAEPTIKDVLDAISKLATQSELRDGLAELRRELAGARGDLVAKIDAHRAETKKGFDDLDEELTGHAKVHREIEKDIENLKRRPARTAARRAARPARRR
ncbi:MAG TPA: hypothetical protein VIF62_20590 [Labilithrix sp.]